MWLKKANSEAKERAPEKLRHSRYYEQDGALRAYANRAMVLSLISLPTTFLAVAFAALVRLQAPPVIRVDSNGTATAVAAKLEGPKRPLVAQGANTAATDFERKAYARVFLEKYVSFSPNDVNRSWADALNMMTANLRRSSLSAIEKEGLVDRQARPNSPEFIDRVGIWNNSVMAGPLESFVVERAIGPFANYRRRRHGYCAERLADLKPGHDLRHVRDQILW